MTAAPICGYAVKLRLLCLQRRQPASPPLRSAQKSSCTAQSCYQQQWTANRQTEYGSLEANGEF
ncbi:hypothetical protein QUB07_13145 [Microcoleus sp. F8-C5]